MAPDTVNGKDNFSIRRRYLLLSHFLITCAIAAVLMPIFITVDGFDARSVAFFERNLPICQKLVDGSAHLVQQSQQLVDMLQASRTARPDDLAFAQKSLEFSKGIARKDEEHLDWNKRMLQSASRSSQYFFYFSVLLAIGLLLSLFISAQRYFRCVWREQEV